MADEVYLTPEERLTDLGDILIQSVIKSDDLSLSNRKFLYGQFTPNVFRDENYIIYYVLYNFKDKGFTPDEAFIKMYLLRNKKLLHDSTGYINLSEFKELDEDPYVAYISAVLKKYNRLLTLDAVDNKDFNLTLEKYKQEFSAYQMNLAYSQSKQILYDGITLGRKFYQGYTDSVAFVKKRIAEIESLMDKTAGAGFIDSRTEAINDEAVIQPTKIGDFDLITELNDRLGGIYTSLFYSVVAPTKGGKSKFCARLAHTAIVKYGVNISVWAHEGGYQAWWAQMRAIHFEYMYIRNQSSNERVAPLSQDDILRGNYPSPEIKALEEASRLDLFTNPNYGNMYMIDRPFVVESFIDEIETSVQLNNSRMVVIDYLQLIGSNSSGGSKKSEYIGKAYQLALAYAKKRDVAILSPAQFKQDFMSEMAKSKDGQAHEVRVAGGESSEIVRTPDVNIALYASTEDLIRKEMTILSMPSRLAEPFPDIPIYADLCSCVFSSIEEEVA